MVLQIYDGDEMLGIADEAILSQEAACYNAKIILKGFVGVPEVKYCLESDDPWKHRSEKMRCKNCMWYVAKEGTIGRCRRHAPSMNGYPVCIEDDWCGDHKLNERVIK